MESKWLSRKLVAAVIAVVVIVLVNLGVPETTAKAITDAIMVVITAYLGGQSAVDVISKLKKPDQPNNG